MRRFILISSVFVAVLALQSPGHIGTPPSLPEIEETWPTVIAASATNCDIVGTSWCLYPVSKLLRATKNGAAVSLTFNSITNDTPHTYHIDTTWEVDLTTLNLQSGDVITWYYWCKATQGPNMNQWVFTTRVTTVQ